MTVYFMINGRIACGGIIKECDDEFLILINEDIYCWIAKSEVFLSEENAQRHKDNLILQRELQKWIEETADILFDEHNISNEIRVKSAQHTAYIKPVQGGYDIEFRKQG